MRSAALKSLKRKKIKLYEIKNKYLKPFIFFKILKSINKTLID